MSENKPLSGKHIVVTGATAGIGLYSLLALARAGAAVIGVGRSAERCRAAETFIRSAVPDAQVEYLLADLSLQSQVRNLAQQIEARLEPRHAVLDVLVNNAGVYSQKLTRTADGIELTLAVNHLAVFLLTHELISLLRAAPQGRVLTVSSNSHYRARLNPARLNRPWLYVGLLAYAQSKLANVLFTTELNRQEEGSRVRAFAVDPGLVNTDIGMKQGGALSRWVWQSRSRRGDPPEKPAKTVLHLCSEQNLDANRDPYWRDCHPKAPGAQALRPDLARDLWEKSLELCGLKAWK